MRPLLRAAGVVALLGTFLALAVYIASLCGAPLTVDIGPSTGDYLEGFTASEERPPVGFRWTTERSAIRLPFTAGGGPAELVIRYARFLPRSARVHVFVSGGPAVSFDARSGRFRTERLSIHLPRGPIRIEFLVEDPDPSRLGIAVDWIRVLEARPLPRIPIVLHLSALIGWALCLRLAGLGWRRSALVAGLGIFAAAAWLARDPFALAHVSSKISLSFLLLVGLVAVVSRHLPEPRVSRWLAVVFALGFLLKGAGIFHPSYFYPDVRNHRRYVFAFAEAEGSIRARGVRAQRQVSTAYPRRVGDKDYAFPYSPLFFIPFAHLPRDPHLVDDAFKQVALAAGALEVVVVFWLSCGITGARIAILAASLAAFLPAMYSRLFLAMWPTIVGHLLDIGVIALAAAWTRRPESNRRMIGVSATALAALLTYISSLFNVTSFLGALAALQKKIRWRLVAIAASSVAVTIVLLYLPFTLTFFGEILPNLLADRGTTGPAGETTWTTALFRVTLFYGYAYPGFSLAGIWLLWRARPRETSPLIAYFWSFVLLLVLRASFGVFRDLKEILYVGPLMAIGTAASLGALASRGRWEKLAALAVITGLLVFWLGKYQAMFEAHACLAGVTD